jgi:hypothetical protein
MSSDSVPTINSNAISETSIPPGTPQGHSQYYITPTSSHPDQPIETPRPATSGSRPHSHVFNGTFLSPSPFSSVSAVITDKLLPHLHTESPLARRIGSRRSRPSLRNSLFVPQDELDDETAEDRDQRGAESDREIVSAVEHPRRRSYYDDGDEATDGEMQRRGFRGRARSLSNTLGELFGVRRKRRGTLTEGGGADEEDQPFMPRRATDRSTETL